MVQLNSIDLFEFGLFQQFLICQVILKMVFQLNNPKLMNGNLDELIYLNLIFHDQYFVNNQNNHKIKQLIINLNPFLITLNFTNMRSAQQNPPLNFNPSSSQKFHKIATGANISFHQSRSPKIIGQVIYEPFEFTKNQNTLQIQTEPKLQIQCRIESVQQRMNKYQQQQTGFKLRIQHLEQENKLLLEQVDCIRRKSFSFNQEASLVQMVHFLERQKCELVNCNKQYEEELRLLMKKLESIGASSINQEKEDFDKEIVALKLGHNKNIESLQEEIEELIVELEQRNVKEKDLQQDLDRMQTENRMLNKYIKVKDGEIVQGKEVRKSCEERIRKLEKVVEQLTKVKEEICAINQVRQQYQQLNVCLSAMKETLVQKQDETKSLREEIQNYKESIRDIVCEKNDLTQTIKELSRILQIERRRSTVRQSRSNKSKFKQQFEGRVKQLVIELSKLRVRMNEDAKLFESEIKTISEKNKSSEIQITQLSATLTMKSIQIKDNYQTISRLQQQLKITKQENNRITSQFNNIKIEHEYTIRELKAKTIQFESILNKKQYEYEQSIKDKLRPYIVKVQTLEQQFQKQKGETMIRSVNNSRTFESTLSNNVSSVDNSNIDYKSHQDRLKLGQIKSDFYKQKTIQLQAQLKCTVSVNKQMKQSMNRIISEVQYLRKELSYHQKIHSQLVTVEQINANSLEQINCLKSDIASSKNISLHRQSSLTNTISELNQQLQLKDKKIKELSTTVSLNNASIESLNKQIQISLYHSSILSQQKFQIQQNLQCLQNLLREKNSEIDGYRAIISKIEDSNNQLCESLSKLKIEMHIKSMQATEFKQELQLMKCLNKGLNDRVEALSNQLIASSSNRMREIMEMHSNVQTMVASLEIFHSKESSFDSQHYDHS